MAERSREVCPSLNLGLRASCQNHGSILLFGLMSSVSYLPVHFPCPESFLGIPRVRAFGASGSYPNLVYSHAEFSPFPNSLPMLFHLPRMPFPLLLYPVKGLLAENEGDGLATVIFILSSFSWKEGIWELLSSCCSTDLWVFPPQAVLRPCTTQFMKRSSHFQETVWSTLLMITTVRASWRRCGIYITYYLRGSTKPLWLADYNSQELLWPKRSSA